MYTLSILNFRKGREVHALNSTKKGTFCNITPEILKEYDEICVPVLQEIWNSEIITDCKFPNKLKLADVTPVFKNMMLCRIKTIDQ